ncbi:MAG TPA: NAD-dependent epimerase/dehydratase family protein [Patescibacteria group bacterium]|nr:NAD-dependent epimerase/dehydratase family protein [Patescibacteria group bacterium]
MKRVLITGGAGFVGSHLVDAFLGKKYCVWVIDNLITGSLRNIAEARKNKHFHFVQDDLITMDLEGKLEARRFDLVYHLASPASPKQYFTYPLETLLVNSYGTHRLMEYFKNTKSGHFIYASTSEVYGDPLVHPQVEQYWGNVNPVGERACYDEGKRCGETFCTIYSKKYDQHITIVRIFNTYGPRMEKDDGRVISNFITQALKSGEITIYGDGHQTRSFCFVSDLVEGLYRAGNIDENGVIMNLGNPTEKKIIDIALLIKKLTHSHSAIVYKEKRTDDPQKRKPDITRAQRLLFWSPHVDLETGLTLTITYFKSLIS